MAIVNYVVDPKTGMSTFENTDLEEVAVGVKVGPATIYHIDADNLNSAEVFVRFYDVAEVTIGTTKTDFVLLVPATTRLQIPIPDGWKFFKTALTVAATLLKTESDTTDPGASAVSLRLLYK